MEGAAAYQQLQTPKDTLSNVAQYWGGIEAKKRAQEEAYRRQDLKDASSVASKEEEYLLPVQTGNQAANRAAVNFSEGRREKIRSNHRLIDQLIRQGKNAEARDLQLQNKKLVAGVRSANDFFENVGGVLADYIKNNDKYDPYDRGMRDILDAFTKGQYTYQDTESGMPEVVVYTGTGKDRKEVRLSESDLMNGFKPSPRYDAFNSFEKIGKGLGIHKQDTDIGLQIKSVKDISPEAKKNLDVQISQVLNDPSKARQAYADLLDKVKEDGKLNDTQKAELKKALESVALGVVDTEETLKSDSSESIKVSWANLRERKNQAKYKRVAKDNKLASLQPMTNQKGEFTMQPVTVDGKNSNAFKYSLGSQSISLTEDPKEKLTAVYVTPDGGIAYDFLQKTEIEEDTVEDFDIRLGNPPRKQYEYKSVTQQPASETEANRIARGILNPETGMPYNDMQELVDATLKQVGTKLNTTKTQPITGKSGASYN